MAVTAKTFIIDASVILAWLLPDEIYKLSANKILTAFGQKTIDLIAPTILPYEILNGIITSMLRKRIDGLLAEKLLSSFQKLEIPLKLPDTKHILGISGDIGISSYDGAYISLAKLHDNSLITADKKLSSILKKNKIQNYVWIENF